MSETFKLSIKPLTPSSIPSTEVLIQAGKDVLSDVEKWKVGKTYHGTMKGEAYNVKTVSKAKEQGDEAAWHCRISEHKDSTFDEFWEKLGRDKATNEKEFIPEIKKVTLLKQISPTQSIWTLHYHLTPPISDRIFTVLQTTHLEGGENGTPRQGWIVSMPVDVSEDAEMKAKEDKGVKGRYTSVELLKEGEDGAVEWTMATSSTPGGSIPQFFAEKSMPSQIFKDVPHFTHWLKGLKATAAKPANGNGAATTATNGDAAAKEVVAPAEPPSEVAAETVDGMGEPVPTGTQATTA